ncbi:hypothetical protein D9M71_483830 [compost metagenome]
MIGAHLVDGRGSGGLAGLERRRAVEAIDACRADLGLVDRVADTVQLTGEVVVHLPALELIDDASVLVGLIGVVGVEAAGLGLVDGAFIEAGILKGKRVVPFTDLELVGDAVSGHDMGCSHEQKCRSDGGELELEHGEASWIDFPVGLKVQAAGTSLALANLSAHVSADLACAGSRCLAQFFSVVWAWCWSPLSSLLVRLSEPRLRLSP